MGIISKFLVGILLALPLPGLASDAEPETAEKQKQDDLSRGVETSPAIELFIAPVHVEDESPMAQSLTPILRQIATGVIEDIDEVRVTLPEKLPDLAERFSDFTALDGLDRLSLINVKNKTGVDGVILMSYHQDGQQFGLHLKLVDLRNGQIFFSEKLNQPVSAALFSSVESAVKRFATSIRRSIRVTVHVTSHPESCQVFVDDKPKGKTPVVIELRTGSYTIKVSQEGYKPHVTTHQLVDGDKLSLHAVLYNPIATRFLNAPPGLRVDSRHFSAGYRYVFVNNAHPEVDHTHFFTLDGELRINYLELGLRVAFAGFESHQRLDTFLGENEGDFSLNHNLIQIMALTKYPVWEKYSFANVKIGVAVGMTYASAQSAAKDVDKWTGAVDAFVETEVRLARGGNFSLDLLLALGFSYLGEVPYLEKTFSPFGEGPESLKNKHLFGPMGFAGLQLKWYNDIF